MKTPFTMKISKKWLVAIILITAALCVAVFAFFISEPTSKSSFLAYAILFIILCEPDTFLMNYLWSRLRNRKNKKSLSKEKTP